LIRKCGDCMDLENIYLKESNKGALGAFCRIHWLKDERLLVV